MEVKTETLKVAKLISIGGNPRNMKDSTRDVLQGNIETFGMVENIVVNRQTMNILGGNQRVQVLKSMGTKEVVCRVVDIEPQYEMEICIALNRIAGTWDEKKLRGIMEEMIESDYLQLTGFDDLEAEMILIGEDKVYAKDFENDNSNDLVKFNFGRIALSFNKDEYKLIEEIIDSKGGETYIEGIING